MNKENLQRQEVTCPICGGMDCRKMRPYQARHVIFSGLDLLSCGECDMVFAHPMPSAEEWAAYNRDFFAESESSSADDTGAVSFFKGIARLRLAHIETMFQGEGLPDSVLEIGPGPGYFCQAYMERQPVAEYCAVETDLTCHGPLREMGVDVVTELEEVDASHGGFGLLVMSHVLEHSQDPRGFIRTALDLLQPGGVLFIEIPCLDFEYKPVFDAHVLFFDKTSLGRLLADAGASDYRLSYHGEVIKKLQRQLSLLHRVGNKVRRILHRFIPPSSRVPTSGEKLLADEDMWAAVLPYMPHVENESPSRWLRALVVKSKGIE